MFNIASMKFHSSILHNVSTSTRWSNILFLNSKLKSFSSTFVRVLLLLSSLMVVRDCVRLQTGMRHAYGKPQGTTARVSIGQVRLRACSFCLGSVLSCRAIKRDLSCRFGGQSERVHISIVFEVM